MVQRTRQPTSEEIAEKEAYKVRNAYRFNRAVACVFTIIAMAASIWLTYTIEPASRSSSTQHSVLLIACMAGAIGAMMTHEKEHISKVSEGLLASACVSLLVSIGFFIGAKTGTANQMDAFYGHQAFLIIATWLHIMFVARRE